MIRNIRFERSEKLSELALMFGVAGGLSRVAITMS